MLTLSFAQKIIGLAALLSAPFVSIVCFAQTTTKSPTKTEVETAIGAICKTGDITRSATGDSTGCRVCPERTTDSASASTGGWRLNAVTSGHFTSASSDELLIGATGCEPHAMNFGGSFLFAREDGNVRVMKYEQGLITDRCHKFSYADGRDYLICQEGWTGQGETFDNVVVISFNSAGETASANLIQTEDTTMTCRPAMTATVRKSAIAETQFTPQDAAQITSFTITATLGNIPCSQVGRKPMSPRWVSAVKPYSIEFLFDGQRFLVAPASRAALQRFAKNQ
jgi:hypothetical protein